MSIDISVDAIDILFSYTHALTRARHLPFTTEFAPAGWVGGWVSGCVLECARVLCLRSHGHESVDALMHMRARSHACVRVSSTSWSASSWVSTSRASTVTTWGWCETAHAARSMRVRVLRGARRLGVLQFVARKGECTQGPGLVKPEIYLRWKAEHCICSHLYFYLVEYMFLCMHKCLKCPYTERSQVNCRIMPSSKSSFVLSRYFQDVLPKYVTSI